MATNAQDKQVIRESLIQFNPNATDLQVVRESLIQFNPNCRDIQIFREVLVLVATTSTNRPVLFAVT